MFKTTVTLINFATYDNPETPTKILAFVGGLQSAGKTDGEVIRTTVGDNFIIERVFTDLETAKSYEDFITVAYGDKEFSVQTDEVTV
jgi:hypothetical protein